MKFKSRVVRLTLIFFLGYFLLFLLRLGYGYLMMPNGPADDAYQRGYGASSVFENDASIKKNYVSTSKAVMNPQGLPAELSQKYEKKGIVAAQTREFESDEKKTRTLISQFGGMVQHERGSGISGSRQLHFSIGVPPASFDELFQAMHGIGRVTSSNVTRIDKTNEFLALKARKVSLEKTLQGLIALKEQNGTVPDFIQLQNRILDIEQQLQNLGVDLGEFDETNSFCTVNLSLYEMEGQKIRHISLTHRVKTALVWSTGFYFMLLGGIFFVGLCSFIVLLVVDRLKLLQKLWETLERK